MNASYSGAPIVDLGDINAVLDLAGNLSGAVIQVSQGVLNANNNVDQLLLSGTGQFNVTGNVNVNDMTWTGGNIGGTGTLTNLGTLVFNSAGTTTAGAALSNQGTVNVQNGTLVLNQGATHASDFDVAAGSTLQFGGNHTLSGNSNFTGGGTINVGGGSNLNITGTTTMGADLACSGIYHRSWQSQFRRGQYRQHQRHLQPDRYHHDQ